MATHSSDSISYLALDSAEKISVLSDMLNISVDCIKLINVDGTIVFMNRSGCEALGINPQEQDFGMDWLALLPASVHKKGRIALNKALQGECAGFRGISLSADNSIIYWDNMLTPVSDSSGKTVSILCISRNITRQVESEKKLRFLGDHDPLTGLANRRTFTHHLKNEITVAKKSGSCFGLLFIDLDNFKNINDTLGHAAGDKAIKQVSAELKKLSPPESFISRLGGDEFAIIVRCQDETALAEVAHHLLSSMNRVVQFRKARATFGITLGAALFPDHGVKPEELLQAADYAMYLQKKAGKHGVRFYSAHKNRPSMTL
ncbi:diguanylate cyclase domain-containing protein [Pantoea vagans]|uniref:diguanylate cyclase domain-containing protein n=1 Tax=Pantoea vagans TaxID=470934 RepID=UPI003FA3AF13